MMNDAWHDSVAKEGLTPVVASTDAENDEPPCPACGTAAPLVAGACSDCGLQLA